jgi:hypothetical protein
VPVTVQVVYGLHGKALGFTTAATTTPANPGTVTLDPKLLGPGLHYDYQVVKSNVGSFRTKGFNLRFVLKDKFGHLLRRHAVTLHSDPMTATTDNDGVVTFEGVTPGQHELILTDNNKSYTQSVVVEDNLNTPETKPSPTTTAATSTPEVAALQTFALTIPVALANSTKSTTKNTGLVAALATLVALVAVVAVIFTKRRRPPLAGSSGPNSGTNTTPMGGGITVDPIKNSETGSYGLEHFNPNIPGPSTVINPEVTNPNEDKK